MRDLTFLSAVFFSLGLVAWAISGAPLNAGYISGLVTAGEFSLFLCAARRHGIDLVANVLAEYACQKGVSVTSKG